MEGMYEELERHPEHHQHPWWRVMCLTGVDYFSTLGYQPGIAFLAAGVLSPIATAILVLVTLVCALPVYRRVAEESPHGEGSLAMLRDLLSWWQGKLVVLVLLGFVATAFVITITLSAADAAAHIEENPLVAHLLHGLRLPLTLLLIAALGAVFLKGFSEAIGIAVVLVAAYLGLNLVVIATGLWQIAQEPQHLADWQRVLTVSHGSPALMVAGALLAFPKLALGLSGFETGVVVMPLVRGEGGDDPHKPAGRIANTRKLLLSAALIMCFYLAASSLVTTVLIPAAEFEPGGAANGRALAHLAHGLLGSVFGTAYDVSTILILWFAGSSAMAGLLNIVPRYLPRYGMAPDWTLATRPLVIVFTLICFVVTFIFQAQVDAQAGAYATGVLVFMLSGAFAVTLTSWRKGERVRAYGYGAATLVFLYATLVNEVERPDGALIALCFIVAIVFISIASRIQRSTELRATTIVVDETARRFIEEVAHHGPIRIVANQPDERDWREYLLKEWEERNDHHIPPGEPILFFEVTITDPSEFQHELHVSGVEVAGYRVLRAGSPSVAHAIAAFLLWIRDEIGQVPHCYFDWTEGSPLAHIGRFLLFGSGDIPPVTREILRGCEPDPTERPVIHVS
ncbi:MAG TPA: amino acid transporter [Chloroflexota bacterium]|nr:amino acid transporter [Chloroflexota bacterium]